MVGRSVGIAAACALGASAFLVPESLTPDSITAKDHSFVSVDPKHQNVEVPCSTCVFPFANTKEASQSEDDDNDEPLFWPQGGANNLLLDFTVSKDGQALEVNGRTIFPFESANELDNEDEESWYVKQVPASASREDILSGQVESEALRVNWYGVQIGASPPATPNGDLIIPLRFQLFAMDNQDHTVDEVAIEILQIEGGELLILAIEPLHDEAMPKDLPPHHEGEFSGPHHDGPHHDGPRPHKECGMLCSLRNMLESKMGVFGGKLGPKSGDCHGRKDGAATKLPGHIKPHLDKFGHQGRPHGDEFEHEGRPHHDMFEHDDEFDHDDFDHEDDFDHDDEFDHEGKPHHDKFDHEGKPHHDKFDHEGKPHGDEEHEGKPFKAGKTHEGKPPKGDKKHEGKPPKGDKKHEGKPPHGGKDFDGPPPHHGNKTHEGKPPHPPFDHDGPPPHHGNKTHGGKPHHGDKDHEGPPHHGKHPHDHEGKPHPHHGGKPGHWHPHGHHHGHHQHSTVQRFLHSFMHGFISILIPVMAGVTVGVSVSIVGLAVGRLISWMWVTFVRGGRRGYASVALDDNNAEQAGLLKAVDADEEALPAYEDSPAYVVDEKKEKF